MASWMRRRWCCNHEHDGEWFGKGREGKGREGKGREGKRLQCTIVGQLDSQVNKIEEQPDVRRNRAVSRQGDSRVPAFQADKFPW